MNYVGVRNLVYKHKQIEKRDGLVFMRAKKRPVVIVKMPSKSPIGDKGTSDYRIR